MGVRAFCQCCCCTQITNSSSWYTVSMADIVVIFILWTVGAIGWHRHIWHGQHTLTKFSTFGCHLRRHRSNNLVIFMICCRNIVLIYGFLFGRSQHITTFRHIEQLQIGQPELTAIGIATSIIFTIIFWYIIWITATISTIRRIGCLCVTDAIFYSDLNRQRTCCWLSKA